MHTGTDMIRTLLKCEEKTLSRHYYIRNVNKKLIGRWDSERELFLTTTSYIVHVLRNTIDARMNSATGRRSSLEPEAKHQNNESNSKAKLKR